MTTITAQEKDLIFRNILNGSGFDEISRAFNKTSQEIDDTFKFVIKKIKSYMFTNAVPYVKLDTIEEAKNKRLFVFTILDKLNLDTAPAFVNIISQPLEEYVTARL